MHIYARMTIHIILGFHHAHLCTNDYFFPISFQCVSVKREYFYVSLLISLGQTDEVEHHWCLSSHGEFLAVFSSNFLVSPYAQRSPRCEYCGTVNTL